MPRLFPSAEIMDEATEELRLIEVTGDAHDHIEFDLFAGRIYDSSPYPVTVCELMEMRHLIYEMNQGKLS